MPWFPFAVSRGERAVIAGRDSFGVLSPADPPIHWRSRSANRRKRDRLVSTRKRRMLARWVRRTANRGDGRDPVYRGSEALLRYRVAAVRTDLLAIAYLLERVEDPDPRCLAEIHALLSDGCGSPLFNPEVHASELVAMVYYVRAELAANPWAQCAYSGEQKSWCGPAKQAHDRLKPRSDRP